MLGVLRLAVGFGVGGLYSVDLQIKAGKTTLEQEMRFHMEVSMEE